MQSFRLTVQHCPDSQGVNLNDVSNLITMIMLSRVSCSSCVVTSIRSVPDKGMAAD